MAKGKTIRLKGKKTSAVLKKLTSKKYVYIRVRAYNTKGGLTSYGKWSRVVRSSRKIK